MDPVSPQQLTKNAEATYLNLIVSWGIQLTPDVRALVSQAVKAGVSSAAFLDSVRRTKFYAQRFPGIMKPNGVMRMTEAQYISGYQSARDYAASVGRSLSPQAYGLAIKNGNSPSEIRVKTEAMDKLRTYGPVFREFSDYLQATGQAKKPLNRDDLTAFVMGQAPKEWADTWRTVYAASQAEQQGISVGKPGEGNDIGYKKLGQIAKQIEVLGSTGDFTGVLAQAQKVLSEGDLRAAGIRKQDKASLVLGGKNAPALAARLQAKVAEKVASFEDRANPNVLTNVQVARSQVQQASE